jgi:hypothetical protein
MVATVSSEEIQDITASEGVFVAVNVCVAAAAFAKVKVEVLRETASSSQMKATAFANNEKLYVCQ